MKRLFLAVFLSAFTIDPCFSDLPSGPEIVSVKRIWDHAPHNAFTDLIRFRNIWWCVFREGKGHAGDIGKVRVLVSKDAEKWESASLITRDKIDLRDPKLSIMPNGRLMLIMGGSFYDANNIYRSRTPYVSFSDSGLIWTHPEKLLAEDHWLWRVTWHKGYGYSISKMGNGRDPRRVMLYRTTDGRKWDWITEFRAIPAWPNEATIRFIKDEMIVLLRRNKTAWIGSSQPPYIDWQWEDSGIQIGGPNFIQLPDGTLWAAGRRYGEHPTQVLAHMTRNTYQPVITLPSGGDCSYPGLVWHKELLWMSYYSSHEGRASIYLAKIRIPLVGNAVEPDAGLSNRRHGISVVPE